MGHEIKSTFGSGGGDPDSEAVVRIQTAIRVELSNHPLSSDFDIARRVGCSSKTVGRYRKRHSIPSIYERRAL